jgi:hypothetical protein
MKPLSEFIPFLRYKDSPLPNIHCDSVSGQTMKSPRSTEDVVFPYK